jgi:hypothetical protein
VVVVGVVVVAGVVVAAEYVLVEGEADVYKNDR